MGKGAKKRGEAREPAYYQRWLGDYSGRKSQTGSVFDELLAGDGQVRPEWERFLRQLDKLRPGDFADRWQGARDLIRENGVTYNIHGDPKGGDRPWDLDPVPWVISESEWQFLSEGLAQRANLFQKLLADFYGERRLVRDGLLPPDLLFGNDRFLRPCADLPVWNDRPLSIYAADVARAPDGRWWVVSDRTQAPAGIGYALENRIVLGRMLPEVARECQLIRMAGFFDQLRESLAASSPNPGRKPHIVLLTPGPRNETYFEQAFLAGYLGLTLAEGEDLTVRQDRVYLKTLEGLEPVDVIWRRVDEEYGDPLELKTDSQLGVPGLLQAIRAGTVKLWNPPGSGVTESPALLAFLPGLCERLLGESLRIPSVATWWCGQEDARRTVLSQLDRLVVKHAFHKGAPVLFGRGIEAESREQLAASIEANPGAYVAQEEIPYSVAPVWNGQGFGSRQVVLRIFLVAGESGFVAFPGGLARVAAEGQERPGISMQQGSGSKDTWVLSPRAQTEPFVATRQRFPLDIRRDTGSLPSRVADNLFWTGRCAERSEWVTRLLREVISRVGSEAGFGALPEVAPLWDGLVGAGYLQAAESDAEPTAAGLEALEEALVAAAFDASDSYSLVSLNRELRRLGSLSRNSLSMDTWRVVRRLGEWISNTPDPQKLNDLLPTLDLLVNLHAALSGLAGENTTRNSGWVFLDLGRRLERASQATDLGIRLLELGEKERSRSLRAMLEAFDSAITYRQRYFFGPRLLPVLDTLFFDPTNPRSLAFQLGCLERHLAVIAFDAGEDSPDRNRRTLAAAFEEMEGMDLSAGDLEEEREKTEWTRSFFHTLQPVLWSFSDEIARRYFSLLHREGFVAGGEVTTRPELLHRP